MPEWLQYGALGLLAAVLAGGGALLKWLLGRMFDEVLVKLQAIRDAIEAGTAESTRQQAAWSTRYDEARREDRHDVKNTLTGVQGAVILRIDEAHDATRDLVRDLRDEVRGRVRSPAE